MKLCSFYYSHRVVTVVAVDGEGAVGPGSEVTVRFDRTCRVLANPDILTLASQRDVDQLSVCSSLGSTRVDIVRGSTDPIVSLLPMRDITVSWSLDWRKTCYECLLSPPPQAMGDLIISGLTHLTDLSGLENLAHYGPELSLVNNLELTTTSHLSANISPGPAHFLSLTNVGVRSNPLLRDLSGLRLISNITGEGAIFQ